MDIEERIRALLALGNDAGATEAEASLAMERAHALLLKHNLDMAEVEASGSPTDATTVVDEEFSYRYSDKWRPSLANVVAKHNYCRVINTGHNTLRFIGRPHNVRVAMDMSRWLMGQVADLTFERWAIEAGVFQQTGDASQQDWKDGFAFGVVNRLAERLKEQKAHEEGQYENVRALSMDLASENQSFMDSVYGRLTHTRVSFNGQAYNVGTRAADGISISPSGRQVDGGRKQLSS